MIQFGLANGTSENNVSAHLHHLAHICNQLVFFLGRGYFEERKGSKRKTKRVKRTLIDRPQGFKNVLCTYRMCIPSVLHPMEKTVYKIPPLTHCTYVSHPYGKQYYLWFTDTCKLIERRTKRETVLPLQFDPCLSGTLLYGTVIYYESVRCFLFDDLFYYKGEQVVRSHAQKVDLFVDLLVQYIQPNPTCVLMLPLMSTTQTTFDPLYKQYSLKIIHETGHYHYLEQSKPNVFTVRSTPKSDIYELYTNNVLQSIAYIDTYKRSAYMNELFEHVKERRMECIWHEPFKKWIPDKCI